MSRVMFQTSDGTTVTVTDRTGNGIDAKDTVRVGNGPSISLGALTNHPRVQSALNDLGIFRLPAVGASLKSLEHYVAALRLYRTVDTSDCEALPHFADPVHYSGRKLGYTADEIRAIGVPVVACPADFE